MTGTIASERKRTIAIVALWTVSGLASGLGLPGLGGPEPDCCSTGGKAQCTTASTGKPGLPSQAEMAKPYGSHLPSILDACKATTDQRVKITAVVESYRSVIQPLREQYVKKNRDYLDRVVKGAKAEEIIEVQGELFQLHQAMCTQYCKMNLDVRRLLSPSQVPQYEEYRAKQGWNRAACR